MKVFLNSVNSVPGFTFNIYLKIVHSDDITIYKQMMLILYIKRELGDGLVVNVYEPIYKETEAFDMVLKELGIHVLDGNQYEKFLGEKTIYFLPFLPKNIIEELLKFNCENLDNLLIISNDIQNEIVDFFDGEDINVEVMLQDEHLDKSYALEFSLIP